MIYLMIYLTVGFVWSLYMLKISFKRYRLMIQDQNRSKAQKRKDYMMIGALILVQGVLFWWAQMYYTIKRGGKLNG